MNRYFKFFTLFIFIIFIASCSSVKVTIPKQESPIFTHFKKSKIDSTTLKSWAFADPFTDSIPGISLEKTYQFLATKKRNSIIVGVIDSGIDVSHEALKNQYWVNKDEILNNHIDDDHNGYTDDTHGWNFLGGDGEPAPEQLEVTRLLAASKKKFEGKTEASIKSNEQKAYQKYLNYQKAYDASHKNHLENKQGVENLVMGLNWVKSTYNLKVANIKNLKELKPDNPQVEGLVNALILLFEDGLSEDKIMDYSNNLNESKNYDLTFNGRTLVGDNPYDINDLDYGNGNVIGSKEKESHGTHVAGIIAASKLGNSGMSGVNTNAKIIAIRAIPDGDEYDKDVALAIRYAVDNGAKVINMSFGKSFSPQKHWVTDAFKYAEKHDVLLVHAAGNDGKNIDRSDNFPTDTSNKVNEVVSNIITVGAIGYNLENFPATFSNYGKNNVDIFAPGHQIYAPIPNNKYENNDGTSMAAPFVSGVASLIRSYYPQLTAHEVKRILINSTVNTHLKVTIPKKEEQTSFSELSKSGGFLNAYSALQLADKVAIKK